MSANVIDPYVLLNELAEELRVHRATIYGWINKGIIPAPCKIGGRLRWRRSVIDQWKAALEDAIN